MAVDYPTGPLTHDQLSVVREAHDWRNPHGDCLTCRVLATWEETLTVALGNENAWHRWLLAKGGREAEMLCHYIGELHRRIRRLNDGTPEGVTAEEWEIIKELRRAVAA